MSEIFRSINREITSEKSLSELDEIIRKFINDSEQVGLWRIKNYSYCIKSKKVSWLMVPPMPIFTININLNNQSNCSEVFAKIKGNVLFDVFIIIGIIGTLISSAFFCVDISIWFGILNSIGMFCFIYLINMQNRAYRKKGEMEFRMLENRFK